MSVQRRNIKKVSTYSSSSLLSSFPQASLRWQKCKESNSQSFTLFQSGCLWNWATEKISSICSKKNLSEMNNSISYSIYTLFIPTCVYPCSAPINNNTGDSVKDTRQEN